MIKMMHQRRASDPHVARLDIGDTTFEGTSEIQRLVISRAISGIDIN